MPNSLLLCVEDLTSKFIGHPPGLVVPILVVSGFFDSVNVSRRE